MDVSKVSQITAVSSIRESSLSLHMAVSGCLCSNDQPQELVYMSSPMTASTENDILLHTGPLFSE